MMLWKPLPELRDDSPRLIIDSREKSLLEPVKEACKRLSVRTKIVPEIKPSGDYMMGSVLIEAKAPFDFINSVLKFTLHDQLGRMKTTTYNIAIAIVGRNSLEENAQMWVSNHVTRLTPPNVEGSIHEFIADTVYNQKVPVLHFQTAFDLVRHIKHGKDIQCHRIAEAWMPKMSDPVLRAFGCPEGIGPDTAIALREQFKSVARMIKATDKDILSVAGIGKKRLEAIRTTFGRV